MNRSILLLLLLLYEAGMRVFCQGLETVPPVLADSVYQKITKNVSFLFTADLRHFPEGIAAYRNCLEIVDANQPWPPRWYFPGKKYSHVPNQNDSASVLEELFFDARYQNGFLTFSSGWLADYRPLERFTKTTRYNLCNEKMEMVDSLQNTGIPLNAQDFRINNKGEKLFMVRLDTLLDMRNLSGQEEDSSVLATIDIIMIKDSTGKLILRWNPVEKLGVTSVFVQYGHLTSLFGLYGRFDWSHGNSACWDFDGNILYSFSHIGIGKISAQDGHLIWHMSRYDVPIQSGTGNIEFRLQQAFDKSSEDNRNVTYTLYSNGDINNPGSYGLQFKVNKENNQLQLVKKVVPEEDVKAFSGGNYEIEKNGDYLLDYGTYVLWATGKIVFLEYRDKDDKLYAKYIFPGSVNAYQVHMLDDWRPPRPVITKQGDYLKATGDMTDWAWYRLSGKAAQQVEWVGKGASFEPKVSGEYCVTGKYGIGYAVSLPVRY